MGGKIRKADSQTVVRCLPRSGGMPGINKEAVFLNSVAGVKVRVRVGRSESLKLSAGDAAAAAAAARQRAASAPGLSLAVTRTQSHRDCDQRQSRE